MDLLGRFLTYLDASPTPLHAVRTTSERLVAAGFRELDPAAEDRQLAPGERVFVRREGSVFAFRIGRKPPQVGGFRVIAAHTDSPNLRVKPNPVLKSHGYLRLGVEPYGGLQMATWVDRDLGVAGAVYVRDGAGFRPVLVEIRRPVARIPTLAIHLNRGVNDDGLKLNAQRELPALFAQEAEGEGDPFRAMLAKEAGCAPSDLLTWDLSLFDLVPAALGGANQEFVFSARLDNLGSCHAGLEALLSAEEADPTSVLALFDHEEIGSRTQRGADGRSLESLLSLAAPGDALEPALERTWLLSADMAHAIHPAFADKSEPEHAPRMNGGPAIKQNVNARYTSEGATTAHFILLCEKAGVPWQWYVHRSDLACGSTVGPMLSSRLGVRSIDVGNPMLSMHSIREQCGARDHERMVKVMAAFLAA
jgi:aspartyl aminopeptidase